MIDKVFVAGSDTVSFVPNLTHKSITPFWVRKKQLDVMTNHFFYRLISYAVMSNRIEELCILKPNFS